MNRAIILGGLGLVGSSLARNLSDDFDVLVIDKKKTKKSVLEGKPNCITMDALKPDELEKIILSFKPNVVVNAINIATIFSKNPEKNYKKIINFYHRLYNSLNQLDGKVSYVQIGTTGSGGLGFNIPFTHGDKLDDFPIISKAAYAGISTSMLTLLSRSFDDRIKVSEIKPGLSIFRKEIKRSKFKGSNLVVIDGGESGLYTYNELALLTCFMGFTTVDVIVKKTRNILDGKKSLHRAAAYDVIENLNSSIIAPRNQDKRRLNNILAHMNRYSGKDYIIATGELGPPSITKDLILGYIKTRYPSLSDHEFLAISNSEMNVVNSLKYIWVKHRGLHKYLVSEITYANYLSIPSAGSEPWKKVEIILRKPHQNVEL